MPASMFISDVLPLPFSPSTLKISPRRTVKSTFSLATTEPKCLVMPRISIIALDCKVSPSGLL